MYMDELIRHTGVVLSADGETARVQIVQTSACQACKARSMCVSSESRELSDVVCQISEPMQAGDQVEVEVRERLAWKAVVIAYIVPFVVMMVVLAGLNVLTEWSEAVTGTLSLCSIALYYIVLSFFKGKLQKQFSFSARKV